VLDAIPIQSAGTDQVATPVLIVAAQRGSNLGLVAVGLDDKRLPDVVAHGSERTDEVRQGVMNASGEEFRHEGVHTCLGWTVPEVPRDEVLKGFLQHLRRLHRSPVTIHQYSVMLTVWFRFCDSRGVHEPGRAEIEAFLDEHPEWLASTANLYLVAMSGFYSWAEAHGLADANPVAGFQRPKLPRNQPHPISEPDLERAIAQATPRWRRLSNSGLALAYEPRRSLNYTRATSLSAIARGCASLAERAVIRARFR
jgi:integrase